MLCNFLRMTSGFRLNKDQKIDTISSRKAWLLRTCRVTLNLALLFAEFGGDGGG